MSKFDNEIRVEIDDKLSFPEVSDGERTATLWKDHDGSVRVDVNNGETSIVLVPEMVQTADAMYSGLGKAMLDRVFGGERDRLSRAEVEQLWNRIQELEPGAPDRKNVLSVGDSAVIQTPQGPAYFSRRVDPLQSTPVISLALGDEKVRLSPKAGVSPDDFRAEVNEALDTFLGSDRDQLSDQEFERVFNAVKTNRPPAEEFSGLSMGEAATSLFGSAMRLVFGNEVGAMLSPQVRENSNWTSSMHSILQSGMHDHVFFVSDQGEMLLGGGIKIQPVSVDGVTYDPYTDETRSRFNQEWLDQVRELAVQEDFRQQRQNLDFIPTKSLLETGEKTPFPVLVTTHWNARGLNQSIIDISAQNASLPAADGRLTRYGLALEEFGKSEIIPQDVVPVLAAGIPAQEANFNNDLVSSADARSAYQILPSTAEHAGFSPEDLDNFDTAVPVARAYFEELWTQFSNHSVITDFAANSNWTQAEVDRHLVLPAVVSAYHAGPGRVSRMLDQAVLTSTVPAETWQRMAVEYARSDIDPGWGPKSVTYYPKVMGMTMSLASNRFGS